MKLYVVGFGPGNFEGMTVCAKNAIEKSDVIVGYTVYNDLMKEFFPDKKYMETGMRKEKERVVFALEEAQNGKNTALICSGDSGVYGMAALAFELSGDYPDVEIEPIAGVTAALSGGAVLGAPLGHDFTVISLSDLLTPWELIEKRLSLAAQGDFIIVLYNPSSKKRADYLEKACDIIMRYKEKDTVCGIVRNIGRDGESSIVLTLEELKNTSVDMFSTVFIGNSMTKVIDGKMVTPRGYKNV